jgi:hypothetical protein
VALPVLLLIGVMGPGMPAASGALAAILALAGLYLYEDMWVKAGQSVAMS